jgi:dTDP-4-dehydrorhamnose 3,5-epimerase/reductase
MLSLAEQRVQPSVDADHGGQPTFTEAQVALISLRNSGAPYGTYNDTNAGQPGAWADVARRVHAHAA